MAALLAGQALRSTDQPGLVRGGHLAWLVATALAGGTVAVAGDMGGWDGNDTFVAAAAAATVVGIALWLAARSNIQVIALGGALHFLAIAVGTLSDTNELVLGSMVALAFGAVCLLLAENGYLAPKFAAQAVGGLLVTWGAFFGGFQASWAEIVAFVVASGLIALSINRGAFVYMVLGLLLGFGTLVRAIGLHVDDPTAAALSLIVVGGLIVGSVILLARRKPWREQPAA